MNIKSIFGSPSKRAILLHLSLLCIIGSIPFYSFLGDLTSDANIGFFTNPSLIISRYSGSWDSTTNFGSPTTSKNGFVIPALIVLDGFDKLGLSPDQIQYAWNTVILIITSFSMYYLSQIILQRKGSWANLLTALAYMSSSFVMYIFHGNSFSVLPYSVLPALVALAIQGVRSGSTLRYGILFAFLIQWASYINITYIFIVIFGITLFLICELVMKRARIVSLAKFTVIASIASFSISAWYMIPALATQLNNFDDTISALEAEGPWLYNTNSSYIEVFRLLGHWDIYSGFAGNPYYSYSSEYTSLTFISFASFLIPIIAILSLLKSQDNYERKTKLFLIIVVLICIPIAVGAYPPDNPEFTGGPYQWLYDNIPVLQIFRNSLKFTILIALAYSLLIGFVTRNIMESSRLPLRVFKLRIPREAIITGLAAIIIISSLPLFDGRIREKDSIVNIPDYWYEAASWINAQEGDWRVLNMPDQYAPVYEWGKPGDDISYSLISKPQIYNIPTELPQVNTIYEYTSRNSTALSELYGIHGVRFIIQRNDVPPSFYGVEDQNQMKNILSTKSNITYIGTFGKLDIYENKFYTDKLYAATSVYRSTGNEAIDEVIGLRDVNKESAFLTGMQSYLLPPEIDRPVYTISNSSDINKNSWVFDSPDEGVYSLYLKYDDVLRQESFNIQVNNDLYGPYSVSLYDHYITHITQDSSGIQVKARNLLDKVMNMTVVAVHVPSGRPWPNVETYNIEPSGTFDVRFPVNFYGFGDPNYPTQVMPGEDVIVNAQVGYTLLDQVKVSSAEGRLFELDDAHEEDITDLYPLGTETVKVGDFYLNKGANTISVNDDTKSQTKVTSIVLIENTEVQRTASETIIEQAKADLVQAQIRTSTPSILVFDESYHEGWKAYLDGRELQEHILVDGYKNGWILRGPTDGNVTVSLAYSHAYQVGLAVSIIAICSSAFLFALSFNALSLRLRKIARFLNATAGNND